MESFVLDASVALSWCFSDDPTENTPDSRRILALLDDADAVVPEIWPLEIANGIFVAFSKRRRITENQIRDYLALLQGLPIQVERREWIATIELEALSRKHNLSAYDVSYLELAMRRKLPLATWDEQLRQAAVAEGIELLTGAS